MANILPETPPHALPAPTLQVFRKLKSLPNSYYIWHHLAPWQPQAPDFLIIHQDGRVFLLKVSLSNKVQAQSAAQLLLIEDKSPAIGKNESDTLTGFLERCHFPVNAPIQLLVIFPNVEQKHLPQPPQTSVWPMRWIGREAISEDSEQLWQSFFLTSPLSHEWIEKLRQQFSPEIVIKPEMTVRSHNPYRLEAGLTSYLLDYDQEIATKSDLEMGLESKDISRDFCLNIVNGVAGSGKTLILLYRLRLLHQLYPQKQFLVLTHNRPLIRDIQSRFNRIEGHSTTNIEWQTFQGWCHKQYKKTLKWIAPISLHKQKELVQQVWQKTLQGSNLSEIRLLSEINWIKDQLPMSQAEYLTVDRRGRGFGMNDEQRLRMWKAIETYNQMLNEQEKMDWGDVPQTLWKFCEQGKIELPVYDAILIDEGQFFAPLWMHLIQKALKPHLSHLFIVADPTQGFLGRKGTWKSLGLQARGHTHALKQSYRTTLQIMQFATLFYRMRIPQENDEDILSPQVLKMPNGAFPQIVILPNPQDEITRVANEITEFVKLGCPRKDILVLHASKFSAETLIDVLQRRLGKGAAMDPGKTFPGNYVRVTTLNAGAGLESPIVFLVGLRELFEEEQSLRVSDEEREAIIQDNTRKIYMAATRAGQRLVLTYAGELPNVLQELQRKNSFELQ